MTVRGESDFLTAFFLSYFPSPRSVRHTHLGIGRVGMSSDPALPGSSPAFQAREQDVAGETRARIGSRGSGKTGERVGGVGTTFMQRPMLVMLWHNGPAGAKARQSKTSTHSLSKKKKKKQNTDSSRDTTAPTQPRQQRPPTAYRRRQRRRWRPRRRPSSAPTPTGPSTASRTRPTRTSWCCAGATTTAAAAPSTWSPSTAPPSRTAWSSAAPRRGARPWDGATITESTPAGSRARGASPTGAGAGMLPS